ncbi:hypothetical protein KXD93_09060 [Mucilaginibacter sp. BJC16-A38]|uniref:hypothetical protein n=1 Tax=Mucilaginibacter phenanthrenivorans TaxID=1234842 RepID=UPI0021588CFD|nr:hypothetical protein [Mucilaginibacter phenanthrenivorans]MCR8557789.1 hypothetical protein [Mucilaginibacter phenanthrenivorans]
MRKSAFIIIVTCIYLFLGCKKDKSTPNGTTGNNGGTTAKGIYADSLFFIQANSALIKPVKTQSGTYSAVPDGLKIDESTGEIDANKSETGLKYKVTFTPTTGNAQTSTVVISGINYEDKIYNLSAGDSIAAPIYNADTKLALPGPGGSNIFDESGGCKNAGIIVNGADAKINLALTVRNQGIDTGATQQVKLAYRMNDNSGKALNGLEIKIYFYRTASEIPQYLTDLIAERKQIIFNTNQVATINPAHTPVLASLTTNAKRPARPRPPCIIVVSR